MDKTKLEKYAEIQAMVQKEARDIAMQVYKEQATKYGVASVAFHTHNNVDSPRLSSGSIQEMNVLPATTGGVANLDILDTQTINKVYAQGVLNPPTVYTYPAPIVFGHGVGTASQFNGGSAPNGTVLIFNNGLSQALNQIWWRADGNWYGCIATLGPMA